MNLDYRQANQHTAIIHQSSNKSLQYRRGKRVRQELFLAGLLLRLLGVVEILPSICCLLLTKRPHDVSTNRCRRHRHRRRFNLYLFVFILLVRFIKLLVPVTLVYFLLVVLFLNGFILMSFILILYKKEIFIQKSFQLEASHLRPAFLFILDRSRLTRLLKLGEANLITLLLRLEARLRSFSVSQVKGVFVVLVLFPYFVRTTCQQTPSNTTTTSTHTVLNSTIDAQTNSSCDQIEFKFDVRMFKELDMHETLLGLYRSCFKKELADNNEFSSAASREDKCEQLLYTQHPEKRYEYILFKLLNSGNIFDQSVLNRIKLVCDLPDKRKAASSIELSVLDKLYLLSSYEHEMCGRVFENSMREVHLMQQVLGLNHLADATKFETVMKKRKNRKLSRPVKKLKRDNDNDVLYFTTSNNFLDFYYNQTTDSPAVDLGDDDVLQYSLSNISVFDNYLSNCTLILLNTYFLAYKTQCDNEGFVESLNHYDCKSTEFSVKSNCTMCQVNMIKIFCKNTKFTFKKLSKIPIFLVY